MFETSLMLIPSELANSAKEKSEGLIQAIDCLALLQPQKDYYSRFSLIFLSKISSIFNNS